MKIFAASLLLAAVQSQNWLNDNDNDNNPSRELTEFTNPSIDAPHDVKNPLRMRTGFRQKDDGSGKRFILKSSTVTTVTTTGKVVKTLNNWSDGEQETIITTTHLNE